MAPKKKHKRWEFPPTPHGSYGYTPWGDREYNDPEQQELWEALKHWNDPDYIEEDDPGKPASKEEQEAAYKVFEQGFLAGFKEGQRYPDLATMCADLDGPLYEKNYVDEDGNPYRKGRITIDLAPPGAAHAPPPSGGQKSYYVDPDNPRRPRKETAWVIEMVKKGYGWNGSDPGKAAGEGDAGKA